MSCDLAAAVHKVLMSKPKKFVHRPSSCIRADTSVNTCMPMQAEQERSRILARLKQARGTRTKPHEPCWFNFHPEVRC